MAHERGWLVQCLVLGCGLLAMPAWPQQGTEPGGAPAQQAPRSAGAGAAVRHEPSHPLAVNLARMGAFSCAERAHQIATFLDPGLNSQAIVHMPDGQPNQRLLMSTLVIPSGGGFVIGNVALAPGQANGCGGSYRAVSYLDMPCAKAVEKHYPGATFNRMNHFAVDIAVLDRNMWVIAMPAGNGCVLEKEEIVQ